MTEAMANGLKFNYHIAGKGERVAVLIHGLIVDNLSSYYFSIAPEVAKHCTTFLYDLRGHGRSEMPASGYSIEAMVSDLHALLKEVELAERPLTLVGNSTGGLVALLYALRHPQHVESVVLVDSHTGRPEFGKGMAETLRLEGAEQEAKARELFGNWSQEHTHDGVPDADLAATMRMFQRTGTRRRNPLADAAKRLVTETSLIADLEASPELTEEMLGELKVPVLAIYGENSDLRAEGERVARIVPSCTLEIMADTSHGIIWQKTTPLRERLGRWIDELP